MGGKNQSVKLSVGVLIMLCFLATIQGSYSSMCKLRRYTHKAMQTDQNGRRCWDDVKIVSCWGFCQSYEISDWKFPYKESHHPVCVHGERKHASHKLRFCDPNVQPGTDVYHYVEAATCRCQLCSSEDTSCEWLPPDSTLLGGKILKDEIEEELDEE